MPPDMAPLNSTIPSCWNAEQKCSCGDCPDAPQCIPVLVSPHTSLYESAC